MKERHQFSKAARNGTVLFAGPAWAMYRLRLMLLVYLSASLMVVSWSANGAQTAMQEGQACGQGPGMNSAKFRDLQKRKSDAYVFGETHGTKESPEQFLRFVCSFIQSANTPPIVGVEVSAASANAVKESLVKDAVDVKGGRQALAKSMFWKNSRDGRSSHANYLLLMRLFALEKQGRLTFVGFDRRVTGKEPFGEAASEFLLASRKKPTARGENPAIIVLTGNGHAKADGSSMSLSDALARRGLVTQVVSLEHTGGTAWVCVGGRCGPTDFSARATCDGAGMVPPAPLAARVQGTSFANGQAAIICIGRITNSPPEI